MDVNFAAGHAYSGGVKLRLAKVEDVIGSRFADALILQTNRFAFGRAGDDKITGGSFDDINGRSGGDVIDGGIGASASP